MFSILKTVFLRTVLMLQLYKKGPDKQTNKNMMYCCCTRAHTRTHKTLTLFKPYQNQISQHNFHMFSAWCHVSSFIALSHLCWGIKTTSYLCWWSSSSHQFIEINNLHFTLREHNKIWVNTQWKHLGLKNEANTELLQEIHVWCHRGYVHV